MVSAATSRFICSACGIARPRLWLMVLVTVKPPVLILRFKNGMPFSIILRLVRTEPMSIIMIDEGSLPTSDRIRAKASVSRLKSSIPAILNISIYFLTTFFGAPVISTRIFFISFGKSFFPSGIFSKIFESRIISSIGKGINFVALAWIASFSSSRFFAWTVIIELKTEATGRPATALVLVVLAFLHTLLSKSAVSLAVSTMFVGIASKARSE